MNSKLIFLTDLFQYLSLSFFLFSLLAFHAGRKKNKMRFTVLMNISLFIMSSSKLLRDRSQLTGWGGDGLWDLNFFP